MDHGISEEKVIILQSMRYGFLHCTLDLELNLHIVCGPGRSLPGFEINGRPVVRDDQNLTLTTKSLNMVAPWTTIGGPHNRFV